MILLFALALAIAAPDTERAGKDFVEANELALKGEMKSAIALYETLVNQGVAHEDLYLNLGNAYAESGREVDAIIAYERGLRLAPGDDDLRANLAFLRSRIDKRDQATEEGTVVLADAIDPFVSRIPRDVFAYIALLLNALLFAALMFRLRTPAIAAGALLAVALVVVAGHFVLARDPRAVVSTATDVKEGPHDRYKVSGRAPAGVRVRVLEEDRGFVKILRPDGTSGWIPANAITRV
jgi:tetratricopeptide (TPR) repeat protein